MPHVPAGDALDLPLLDLAELAAKAGPAPWREMLVGTGGLRVVLLRWPPGYATVPHVHPHAEEIFLVLEGRAVFAIGEEPELEAGPGSFLFARRGELHAIRVPEGGGDLTLLASVAPNEDRPDETIEPLSFAPPA